MSEKRKKRYEASYVHPNFCDGFWDNKETKYLDIDEIEKKLYENLEHDEIEEILNRSEKEENGEKNMGNLKLALEGFGIVVLGIVNIIWHIVKLISCIFIAGLISIKLGLNGYYWWFSTIIIFCLLNKIVFFGNTSEAYNELVDKYNGKLDE